jgi:hypothetical protein
MNADPWALLSEARQALSQGCWNGSCCVVRARIDAALAAHRDEGSTEVEWIRAGLNSFLTTTDDTACVVELSNERWNWDARIYGDCATEAEARRAATAAARGLR